MYITTSNKGVGILVASRSQKLENVAATSPSLQYNTIEVLEDKRVMGDGSRTSWER